MKRDSFLLPAALALVSFGSGFVVSHAANIHTGSSVSTKSPDPHSDCPISPDPKVSCPTCQTDGCDLHPPEYLVPDPTFLPEPDGTYLKVLACIDFDGSYPAHCCKVEQQPHYILAPYTGDWDGGWYEYNGTTANFVGNCRNLYCAGGEPTAFTCGSFDAEGDSTLTRQRVFNHGRR